MNVKTGLSVVEVTIVVALLLLIAAISVPSLRQNLQKKRAAECALNLESLDLACKKYAAEKGAPPLLSFRSRAGLSRGPPRLSVRRRLRPRRVRRNPHLFHSRPPFLSPPGDFP